MGLSMADAYWAMIVLQLGTGAVLFAVHGRRELSIPKNMQAFKGMGYPSFVGLFQSLVEGYGSILLALGIFPKAVAGLLVLSMLGAQHYHWKRGDRWQGERAESLLFLVVAVAILLGGVSPWGLSLF